MSELTQNFPADNLNQTVGGWINKRVLGLSKHWLAAVNTFFFLYVGLPFLAPVLLANGFTRSANAIYWVYSFLCHLLPSRAYFVEGEQVCLCERCIAIYATLFAGGVAFSFVRHRLKPLAPKWYVFFMLPMALDGGTALASELSQIVPLAVLWGVGLVVIGLAAAVLYSQKQLSWPPAVFLASGLLALAYLQFVGPHESNLFLRSATGFIFSIGTVWVAYPLLQESFGDIYQDTKTRLTIS